MKKLLVFMLVLGMASTANAAIVLDAPTTIHEGDTVSIGLNNLDGRNYLAYINVSKLSEGGFAMSNPQLTALAGDFSGFLPPYEYADSIETEVCLAQSPPGFPSTPGIQFTWDLTCLQGGVTVTVERWQAIVGGAVLVETLIIEQEAPEPTTLVLLGLSGLLALRRRK